MEHVQVVSSQIASIAHDPATATMQVLFKRGGLYEYPDVTSAEFEQVLNPGSEHNGSVGVAFAKVIKEKKTFRKIEGQPWPENTGAAAPAVEPQVAAPTPYPEPLPDEVQVVSRKSKDIAAEATAIEVHSPAEQEHASEVLKAVAAMRQEIANTFKPMKDAAYKAHRTICDKERQLDAPLLAAETSLKRQIGSYVQEQQRLAREHEERLRREAQERAEAEAKRLADEEALQQAEKLAERGDMAAAEAVLSNPSPVPVPYVAPAPVMPAVAEVKGVATRMEWDFRVTKMEEIPREYLLVNEAAIRSVVKATRGKIRIPGVEAFEKTVVATSRRG